VILTSEVGSDIQILASIWLW